MYASQLSSLTILIVSLLNCLDHFDLSPLLISVFHYFVVFISGFNYFVVYISVLNYFVVYLLIFLFNHLVLKINFPQYIRLRNAELPCFFSLEKQLQVFFCSLNYGLNTVYSTQHSLQDSIRYHRTQHVLQNSKIKELHTVYKTLPVYRTQHITQNSTLFTDLSTVHRTQHFLQNSLSKTQHNLQNSTQYAELYRVYIAYI